MNNMSSLQQSRPDAVFSEGPDQNPTTSSEADVINYLEKRASNTGVSEKSLAERLV